VSLLKIKIPSKNMREKPTFVGFSRIYLMKCKVQEAKSPVKNLFRQRCAKGFNSGVKGLITTNPIRSYTYYRYLES
jgi:hypothetical protein